MDKVLIKILLKWTSPEHFIFCDFKQIFLAWKEKYGGGGNQKLVIQKPFKNTK